MEKIMKRIIISAIALEMLILMVSSAGAQPTAISFGVDDASGYQGTFVKVPVNITDVRNESIASIRFDISFDTGVINLTKENVQKGDLTSEWDIPSFNPANGMISIVLENNTTAIPTGASGSVVILNFSVVGAPGASSAMNISGIELSGLEGDIGTAEARNGTFTIEAQPAGGIISGITFNDSNSNAEKDADESGLANWTIVLKDGTGSTVKTNITDVNGNYTFDELAEGNYTVEEVVLAGWTQTYPEAPGIYEVMLEAGEILPDIDFGNMMNETQAEIPVITAFTPPTSQVHDDIGSTRTFTINVDQIVNVSWQINGSEVFNQTNVNTSSYSNTSASAGTWNVSALVQNANGSDVQTWDWIVTAPSIAGVPSITSWSNNKTNDASLNITVVVSETIHFKATANQSIEIWNWLLNNVNQNNNFDNFSHHFVAPGNYIIKVNASNTNGTSATVTWNVNVTGITPPTGTPNITDFYPPATTVTNNVSESRTFSITTNQTVNVSWLINGIEVFNENAGVTEASYTNTSAAEGTWNVSALVQNANGSDMQTWKWIVKRPIGNGSISGIKFNDSNGNAVKDAGESGLANWTIVLKDGTKAQVNAVMTDNNGNYIFSGVTAGNYTVEEVLQAGWRQTFPEAPGIYDVSLAPDQQVTGIDFGNNLISEPGVNAIREIEKVSLRRGESTNITVRINSNIKQALALHESIPAGWNFRRISDNADGFKNSTNEWVWSNVTPGITETVIYSITAPADAYIGTYYINGTISNSNGVIAVVGGNDIITLDILEYYRKLGSDPDRLETGDLLEAMEDWRNEITPVGFAHPITIQELYDLINEWIIS